MAGLEGTIGTPFGTVQKKTALIVGGGAVAIAGIVWYRQKKLADAAPAVTDGEIDPATGYPYGSPEDAAALADQNNYVSPPATGGGGGSGVPPSNVGYTSNGQWVQAVIETMTNNGTLVDPSAMSAALGKYVTGAYVAADDANTNSLIQQAIAAEGFPPIAGSNGYPPSINRTPPASGGPTTPTPVDQNVHIVGLKAASITSNSIIFQWSFATTDKVKPDYLLIYKDNAPIANTPGTYTKYGFNGLKSKTTYKFTVRGVKGSTIGPSYSVSAKTK